MRIALVTDGVYPFAMGGMQKHSFYLASYLAKKSFEVTIFHPHVRATEGEMLEKFDEQDRKYLSFKSAKFPKHASYPGHYLVESYFYSKSVSQLLNNDGRFDFIYVQGFSGWFLLKHRWLGSKTPIGINFHGLNMFQPVFGFKNKIVARVFRFFARRNMKRADVVYSLGGNLTTILQQAGFGYIEEVPVGIDSSWLSIGVRETGEKIRFLFVGRNDKIKAFDMISACFSELLKSNSGIELHIVGPVKDEKLEKFSSVKLHGEISDEKKLRRIYQSCNILICSSYSEGMPTVILEAMACGMPVLATQVGAISELVDDENGILISAGSPTELMNAVRQFSEMDRTRLKSMGVASLTKVQARFTWDKVILLVEESVRKTIKRVS